MTFFDHALSRAVYFAVVVVAAVALSVVGYGVYQQGQAINEGRNRLAQLTEQLCRTLSEQRVATNDQLRVPLRDTEEIIAALSRSAAERATTKAERRRLTAVAKKFEHLADTITLVGPYHCTLGPGFGSSSPQSIESSFHPPAGPWFPSPTPAPAVLEPLETAVPPSPPPSPHPTPRPTPTVCHQHDKPCHAPSPPPSTTQGGQSWDRTPSRGSSTRSGRRSSPRSSPVWEASARSRTGPQRRPRSRR